MDDLTKLRTKKQEAEYTIQELEADIATDKETIDSLESDIEKAHALIDALYLLICGYDRAIALIEEGGIE